MAFISSERFSLDLPRLIVIRGIPGAGKDTVAQFLGRKFGYIVMSPDDYLDWSKTCPSGSKIESASRRCFWRVCEAIRGNLKVIVHHNFTYQDQVQHFLGLVPKNKYLVIRVITIYHSLKPITNDRYHHLCTKFQPFQDEEHVFYQKSKDELYFLKQ